MKKTASPLPRRWLLVALAASLTTLAACHKTTPPPQASDDTSEQPELVINTHVAVPLARDEVLLAGDVFNDAGPSTWGWIAKVAKDGHRLWQKELGKKAQSSSFNAGLLTDAGNVLLAGTVNEGFASYEGASAWIVALKDDGSVRWDKGFNLGTRTHALAVVARPENKYLVMGSVREGDRDSKFTDRAWVLEVDAAGHESLKTILASPDTFVPAAVGSFDDGSFVVAGKVFVGPDQTIQGWIGRFDADGKPQWSRTLELKDSNIVAAFGAPNGGIVLLVAEDHDKPVRVMHLDLDGSHLQDGGLVAVCDGAALWRDQRIMLKLTGFSCPAKGEARTPVVVEDLEHRDRVRKLDAGPGVEVSEVLPLPGRPEVGLFGRRQGKGGSEEVFVTRVVSK